ncbi:MAG TPA: hypothetical protein VII43_06240 [Opitutaceae bacterium]
MSPVTLEITVLFVGCGAFENAAGRPDGKGGLAFWAGGVWAVIAGTARMDRASHKRAGRNVMQKLDRE